MQELSGQRCFNHGWREAVAYCVDCDRYYCRECIIEHEERMICAACLAKLSAGRAKRRAYFSLLSRPIFLFLGFMTVWLFFYLAGKGLLALPSKFHEGNMWRTTHWSFQEEFTDTAN